MKNNLQEIRKAHKMSQTELAKKLNVIQNTISNWEIGKTEIDFKNLKRISEIFNVSIDEILDNNPPEAKGFPTLADFNKDLMAHGFSIEQYEALSETEKNALLNTIKTLVESFKNDNK